MPNLGQFYMFVVDGEDGGIVAFVSGTIIPPDQVNESLEPFKLQLEKLAGDRHVHVHDCNLEELRESLDRG